MWSETIGPAVGWACLILIVLGFLWGVALGPIGPGNGGIHNEWVQQAHVIGLALYSYSIDNDQTYPDGTSSTAVFQKLMDGGYISDPHILYVPMAGKTEPTNPRKLKPENVSFDVTLGVGPHDSNKVPLIFLTGFRVTYAPGAGAIPLGAGLPSYGATTHRFLFFSWSLAPQNDRHLPGIAVLFSDRSATWLQARGNTIPNFVPQSFAAHGNVYHQLTPEGILH